MIRTRTAAIIALLLPAAAAADPPQVTAVRASVSDGTWRIEVTLTHPDTGWEHYADGWRVLDAAGNRIALRTLLHPHVDEQPFTRALTGIAVAAGTAEIFIEPRCSVEGWSGVQTRVTLP